MSSSPDTPGAAGTGDGPGPPPGGQADPPGHAAPPVCPRHPDRVSYVRCQRCERPTCPQCQRPAAVGIHCVDCVRADPAVRARTVVGAVHGGGRPLLTQALLVVLAVVYVLQLVVPGVTSTLGFSPVVSQSQPWRFLTAGLVHSPSFPFHLLLNGVALWVVGRELEPVLGRARLGAVLGVSTLASSVGVLWLTSPQSPAWAGLTVGASGAVFGLLGAGVVLDARRGAPFGRQLAVLGVLAVAGFLLPGISWQGHVGGLVGGLASAAVLLLAPRARRQAWQVAGLALVVLGLVGLVLLRWALVPDGLLF
ncbi:rhomboid family intramembrane serine protease [Aquipuribacter nitratireducens]|uniref:Rhomboid family intramembrane serine protease n=1 Tax=Aquipuribacter nitratireducens TaxID=650104 RepID=A0ABW0GSL2_9MICO